jgi:glyoxylase-like metal-dependent hydrolase (beta-lactamase superfamily II)
MLRKCLASLAGVAVLASCATTADRPASVERMYVIDCGENHVKDMARWSAPDAGKSIVFSNHCYLIRHAKGWMLWDTGNADRLAALPNGLTAPNGLITAYMKKPLADSLKEIGVAPVEIRHFAMSHSHGDHSGNANLFAASTLYMQTTEYDAVFGPEPQKFNFIAANFEQLRGAKVVKLNGDHDVFGDGSVVIKSAPGHTPGHQALFVRLAKTGPVVLSGDMVHFLANWNAKRVPALNFNAEQSAKSMQMVEQLMAQTGAKLWINHDPEQGKTIPKAPAYVE